MAPQPWPRKSSKRLADYRIFTIRSEEKVSPRTGQSHEFYVIDSVDWVNVVPLTADGRVVMIEQYRHGSNTVELEIPGGMMDEADRGSPEAAAIRELREETGYEGRRAEVLGRVYPNPAIQSNTCHSILVHDCRLIHPTQFDYSEDLVTRLVPVHEIGSLVRTGKIRHSLVVVALYHFLLWRQERPNR